jgi:cell division protein FtsN
VTPQPQPHPATPRTGRYVVQVGAFSQEANAKALQKKLASIGQDATIDHTSLYLVRIGPFETRDQAASVRAKLEAAGISAIITTQ